MWTGSVTHALPAALIGVGRAPLSPAAAFRGDARAWRSARSTTRCFCCRSGSASIGRKGVVRFLLGFAAMVAVLVVTLGVHVQRSGDVPGLPAGRCSASSFRSPRTCAARGNSGTKVYRYPIIAAFIGLSMSFVTLAGAEEPGHADQLLGRADAGHAVLARPQRRPGAWPGTCRCCCSPSSGRILKTAWRRPS